MPTDIELWRAKEAYETTQARQARIPPKDQVIANLSTLRDELIGQGSEWSRITLISHAIWWLSLDL